MTTAIIGYYQKLNREDTSLAESNDVAPPSRGPCRRELGTYCGCAARVRKKSSIRPIASLNWSTSIGLTM
jgi:hypothetical protein